VPRELKNCANSSSTVFLWYSMFWKSAQADQYSSFLIAFLRQHTNIRALSLRGLLLPFLLLLSAPAVLDIV
jgi:hypothetical protein